LEIAATYSLYPSATGFFRSVIPFINFCYSDFKYSGYQFQALDKNGEAQIADYDGKAVAGVSPVTANAGIDLGLKWGLYAAVSYNYRDAMPITSDGAYTTSAFSLLNAKMGVRQHLLKHFDLDVYFGADNITGTQYYYMVFLNQLPDAYLPAPYKISFYGGIGLKYTF